MRESMDHNTHTHTHTIHSFALPVPQLNNHWRNIDYAAYFGASVVIENDRGAGSQPVHLSVRVFVCCGRLLKTRCGRGNSTVLVFVEPGPGLRPGLGRSGPPARAHRPTDTIRLQQRTQRRQRRQSMSASAVTGTFWSDHNLRDDNDDDGA